MNDAASLPQQHHPRRGRTTHRITFGHNNEHRPDLKQLLYVLTTTADGAVPVWCSVDHGNTTDDQTHIATWDTLCRLGGRPDFLYVADSKLCTKENMAHLASRGGRFVTVRPQGLLDLVHGIAHGLREPLGVSHVRLAESAAMLIGCVPVEQDSCTADRVVILSGHDRHRVARPAGDVAA